MANDRTGDHFKDGFSVRGEGKETDPPQEELPLIPVIPIVFLPGIMASYLRVKPSSVPEVRKHFEDEGRGGDFTEQAWHTPNMLYSVLKTAKSLAQETVGANCQAVRVAKTWEGYGPKLRQVLLNPKTVEVDRDGFLPGFVLGLGEIDGRPAMEVARERGWGSVHWDLYWKLLKFLTNVLNPCPPFDQRNIRARKRHIEHYLSLGEAYELGEAYLPTEAEVDQASRNRYPVHAMGYNWTQSNMESARDILKEIAAVIQGYQEQGYTCKQVIVVTHSMGGLVARTASQMDRNEKQMILGIVHGVMPAIGAPVAYRRMVGGTEHGSPVIYKDLLTAFSSIAGKTAAETTPVMANAPGALELLPSHLYPFKWLKVEQDLGNGECKTLFELPDYNDPYKHIYKEKEAWWRMVNPALLDPAGLSSGNRSLTNSESAWRSYIERIEKVEEFHKDCLSPDHYHKPCLVFYGNKERTYATVRWRLPPDTVRFSTKEIHKGVPCKGDGIGACEFRVTQRDAMTGKVVNGNVHFGTDWQVSAFLQGADDTGDGTVPEVSGNAPAETVPNIKSLHGFDHAGVYKHMIPQILTLMAICKLAGANGPK